MLLTDLIKAGMAMRSYSIIFNLIILGILLQSVVSGSVERLPDSQSWTKSPAVVEIRKEISALQKHFGISVAEPKCNQVLIKENPFNEKPFVLSAKICNRAGKETYFLERYWNKAGEDLFVYFKIFGKEATRAYFQKNSSETGKGLIWVREVFDTKNPKINTFSLKEGKSNVFEATCNLPKELRTQVKAILEFPFCNVKDDFQLEFNPLWEPWTLKQFNFRKNDKESSGLEVNLPFASDSISLNEFDIQFLESKPNLKSVEVPFSFALPIFGSGGKDNLVAFSAGIAKKLPSEAKVKAIVSNLGNENQTETLSIKEIPVEFHCEDASEDNCLVSTNKTVVGLLGQDFKVLVGDLKSYSFASRLMKCEGSRPQGIPESQWCRSGISELRIYTGAAEPIFVVPINFSEERKLGIKAVDLNRDGNPDFIINANEKDLWTESPANVFQCIYLSTSRGKWTPNCFGSQY